MFNNVSFEDNSTKTNNIQSEEALESNQSKNEKAIETSDNTAKSTSDSLHCPDQIPSIERESDAAVLTEELGAKKVSEASNTFLTFKAGQSFTLSTYKPIPMLFSKFSSEIWRK